MGAYAKNDRIDANMIRYYAKTAYPKGRLQWRESRSEVGRVSNKEIAALVGVATYSKDSGKKTGKRTLFGGRALIRSVLYMAILSAKRFNKPIKTFYQRLIAGGKLEKVALTACMRKLLITLNSMVKHQLEWHSYFPDLA